jgi:membrane-associated phospholipid phosphatase
VLTLAVCLGLAWQASASAVPASAQGWWRTGDLVDYGVIVGALGGYAALHAQPPLQGTAIGPQFDPNQPAAILSPAYAPALGRRFVQEDAGETVPAAWVGAAIPAVGLWLAAQEGLAGPWDGYRKRHVHDTLIGLGENVAGTLLLTEVLKYAFGRLRPDFQERVVRYYCHQANPQGVPCPAAGVPALDPDAARVQKVFDDGRRSFPSGHASTSFALATYAALVTGGHFVWGEDAGRQRTLGIAVQAGLLGLASFVAWSRVHDGRHNPSDVLTGAAIGASMANFAYWRRFDRSGRSRHSGLQDLSLTSGAGEVGLGLAWTW